MKIKFLFLLFIFVLSSYSYESSRFIFEKEWIIEGEAGSKYIVNSSFIYNGSTQKILSLESSEGYFINSEDNIFFISQGEMESTTKKINAYAIVEVKFSPFLKNDEPLDLINEPENEIQQTAKNLSAKDSKAKTLISLVGWMEKELDYSLNGIENKDPLIVFEKRKAVCEGYSNLLSYFLSYLKIENKKIYGYVYSGKWEEHAWIEAKISEEWISADPTFNEIGLLSPNHIKTFVSDCKEPESTLYFNGKNSEFYSKTKVEQISSTLIENNISHIATSYKRRVDVFISNPTENYVFLSYKFEFPDLWGENSNEIILLSPNETIIKSHRLSVQPWLIKSNAQYYIPYIVSIFGEETTRTTIYDPQNQNLSKNDDFFCLSTYFFSIPIVFFIFYKKQ